MRSLKQLQQDTTRGLWCIDRNPADVDYERIKKNALQLQDDLTGPQLGSGGITIDRFTLNQTGETGKILMTGPLGEAAEIDEKVLEDLLASVF